MAERRIPTREEVLSYLHQRRNWGRWGQDDQVGAINLITPAKRVKAALAVWRIDGDAKAALPVLLAVVEHIPTVVTAPGQNLAVIHAFDALGQMGPAAKPAAPKMRQIAAQGAGWSFQATNALNKIEPHTQPSSQPGLPPG